MARRCLLPLAIVALVASTGCTQREDLAVDTVRVRWSDRTTELDVVSCGLDEDVFVLGASSSDAFVQMLLVVVGDTVDPEASAVSVEVDGAGVSGAGSATLLEVGAGVPGEITDATIRGDRIDVAADARVLARPGSEVVEIEIDARCTAVEDFV